MHVNLAHYLDSLRCILPRELLLQQAHHHLMDLCPICRSEWDGQPRFETEAPRPGHAETRRALADRPLPPECDFSLDHYDEELAYQSRLRAIARRAREDVAKLRRLPPGEWAAKIDKSKTRFRSRAFVLLLFEEAKKRVRTAPREAAAWASLVPLALDRGEGREGKDWVRELRLLAAAHHANALRVAGDLAAADREFAELSLELQRATLANREVEAEIASLEASLRTGQRRFGEAERLLARAAANAGPNAARLAIKYANLSMFLGHTEKALASYETAARTLDSDAEPLLWLCVVTGRVNCLCDLDRYAEAERLLAAERAGYLRGDDDFDATYLRFLTARVALGNGDFAAAERGFTATQDRFLQLDRGFDATVACLYLADTLLAAGKTAELRRLATGLVALFQSRGVERETVASVRLLAQAVQADTLTAALLARMRTELQAAPSATGPVATSATED